MEAVCANCGHDEFAKDDYGNFVCDDCGFFVSRALVCDEQELDTLEVAAEALEFYGHDAQILKTMEELCELGAELMHFRDGKASADVVAGELADVMIMCEQMRLLLGADLVDGKVEEKITRLDGMLRARQAEREVAYGRFLEEFAKIGKKHEGV